jgi:predicted nucleic-acid-binding Zn-ribbon protein
MDVPVTACPVCQGHTLYQGPVTSGGGGQAPNYLPGLGRFLAPAKFVLVVCRDCGLTQFFVEKEARKKLGESKKWQRL